MNSFLYTLAAVLALSGPEAATPRADEAEVSNCLVALIADIQVSAQEPGLMTELHVQEGSQVKEGELLAQLDSRQGAVQKKAAEAERNIAKAKADTDINIQYAKSAYQVAKSAYDLNSAANKTQKAAVPREKLQQLFLESERARLAIEQAELEHKTDGLTLKAKEAEVEATDTLLDRMQVKARFDGDVVEIFLHPGEWAQPGTPLLRMVRMNRLWVKGTLNLKDYYPQQVYGRKVRVLAQVGPDRTQEFPGKITYVHPEIQQDGYYQVWAEVDNQQEDQVWLLYPGLKVSMFIQMSEEKAAAIPPRKSGAK